MSNPNNNNNNNNDQRMSRNSNSRSSSYNQRMTGNNNNSQRSSSYNQRMTGNNNNSQILAGGNFDNTGNNQQNIGQNQMDQFASNNNQQIATNPVNVPSNTVSQLQSREVSNEPITVSSSSGLYHGQISFQNQLNTNNNLNQRPERGLHNNNPLNQNNQRQSPIDQVNQNNQPNLTGRIVRNNFSRIMVNYPRLSISSTSPAEIQFLFGFKVKCVNPQCLIDLEKSEADKCFYKDEGLHNGHQQCAHVICDFGVCSQTHPSDQVAYRQQIQSGLSRRNQSISLTDANNNKIFICRKPFVRTDVTNTAHKCLFIDRNYQAVDSDVNEADRNNLGAHDQQFVLLFNSNPTADMQRIFTFMGRNSNLEIRDYQLVLLNQPGRAQYSLRFSGTQAHNTEFARQLRQCGHWNLVGNIYYNTIFVDLNQNIEPRRRAVNYQRGQNNLQLEERQPNQVQIPLVEANSNLDQHIQEVRNHFQEALNQANSQQVVNQANSQQVVNQRNSQEVVDQLNSQEVVNQRNSQEAVNQRDSQEARISSSTSSPAHPYYQRPQRSRSSPQPMTGESTCGQVLSVQNFRRAFVAELIRQNVDQINYGSIDQEQQESIATRISDVTTLANSNRHIQVGTLEQILSFCSQDLETAQLLLRTYNLHQLNNVCSICHIEMSSHNCVRLLCTHAYHLHCIQRALNQGHISCACCRTLIDTSIRLQIQAIEIQVGNQQVSQPVNNDAPLNAEQVRNLLADGRNQVRVEVPISAQPIPAQSTDMMREPGLVNEQIVQQDEIIQTTPDNLRILRLQLAAQSNVQNPLNILPGFDNIPNGNVQVQANGLYQQNRLFDGLIDERIQDYVLNHGRNSNNLLNRLLRSREQQLNNNNFTADQFDKEVMRFVPDLVLSQEQIDELQLHTKIYVKSIALINCLHLFDENTNEALSQFKAFACINLEVECVSLDKHDNQIIVHFVMINDLNELIHQFYDNLYLFLESLVDKSNGDEELHDFLKSIEVYQLFQGLVLLTRDDGQYSQSLVSPQEVNGFMDILDQKHIHGEERRTNRYNLLLNDHNTNILSVYNLFPYFYLYGQFGSQNSSLDQRMSLLYGQQSDLTQKLSNELRPTSIMTCFKKMVQQTDLDDLEAISQVNLEQKEMYFSFTKFKTLLITRAVQDKYFWPQCECFTLWRMFWCMSTTNFFLNEKGLLTVVFMKCEQLQKSIGFDVEVGNDIEFRMILKRYAHPQSRLILMKNDGTYRLTNINCADYGINLITMPISPIKMFVNPVQFGTLPLQWVNMSLIFQERRIARFDEELIATVSWSFYRGV